MNAVCEQIWETLFSRKCIELCDKQVVWMLAHLSPNFILQYFLDTPARTAEKRGKDEALEPIRCSPLCQDPLSAFL